MDSDNIYFKDAFCPKEILTCSVTGAGKLVLQIPGASIVVGR